MFDYFTVDEIAKFTFYRIPKLLITDEKFRQLSCEAKLLYGLLLDRAGLSKSKKWVDEDGKIYVYFRLDEVQEMLNIASGKAVRIFKELDTIGLINRVKQGQGKPTKIYVMNFSQESAQCQSDHIDDNTIQTFIECGEKQVKTFENRKSEKSSSKKKVKTCENRKSAPSKIESLPFLIGSKTEYSDINPSSYSGETKRKSEISPPPKFDMKKMETALDEVKQQISYSELPHCDTLNELVQIMAWIYVTPESEIPISGVLIDTPIIIERFRKIGKSHIDNLISTLRTSNIKIKCPRNYLLTCLYNSPINIDESTAGRKSSFNIDELDSLSMFND